jgi:hypothetical protein
MPRLMLVRFSSPSLPPRTYIESIMTELCTYFTSIIIELLFIISHFHIQLFQVSPRRLQILLPKD